jgi:hypothetical protein
MALNLELAVAVILYALAVPFSALFEVIFNKLLSEFFKKKENCLEKKNLKCDDESYHLNKLLIFRNPI